MKFMLAVCCFVSVFYMFDAGAEEFEVVQQHKKFSRSQITITKGDTINFPNKDPFFHNVYSLSATKSFELGSYPSGQSRKITFDTPGTILVECAIHPSMRLTILVK